MKQTNRQKQKQVRVVWSVLAVMLCGLWLGGACEPVVSQEVAVEPVADAASVGDEPVVERPVVVEAPVERTAPPEPLYAPDGRLRLPAQPAKTKRYAGGTCPVFKAGSNTIEAEFFDRTFQLYLPDKPKGAPLLFIWHPLGGNANQIATAFGAAQLAKLYGAVVAVPSSCCSGPKVLPCCSRVSEWSYVKEYDVDLSFFDGMLTCIDKQYDIDNSRVYTTGFSAGSLFSSMLVVYRSEYLAAAAIFSGGVGLFEYETPLYPIPVVISWGGTNDVVGGVVKFDGMTREMITKLRGDGHFVIGCNHGRGHTIPSTAGTWAFPFLFDHTFGDGKSPYVSEDKRKNFPAYCEFPK